MKKAILVLLPAAVGMALSLGLSFLNLYWTGFAAGRVPAALLVAASALCTSGVAFTSCLLGEPFRRRYQISAPRFFLIAFGIPLFSAIALFVTASSASIAASLLALGWTLTSSVFAAAGAASLGILTFLAKRRGE